MSDEYEAVTNMKNLTPTGQKEISLVTRLREVTYDALGHVRDYPLMQAMLLVIDEAQVKLQQAGEYHRRKNQAIQAFNSLPPSAQHDVWNGHGEVRAVIKQPRPLPDGLFIGHEHVNKKTDQLLCEAVYARGPFGTLLAQYQGHVFVISGEQK